MKKVLFIIFALLIVGAKASFAEQSTFNPLLQKYVQGTEVNFRISQG